MGVSFRQVLTVVFTAAFVIVLGIVGGLGLHAELRSEDRTDDL
jgi:hypothetical protein